MAGLEKGSHGSFCVRESRLLADLHLDRDAAEHPARKDLWALRWDAMDPTAAAALTAFLCPAPIRFADDLLMSSGAVGMLGVVPLGVDDPVALGDGVGLGFPAGLGPARLEGVGGRGRGPRRGPAPTEADLEVRPFVSMLGSVAIASSIGASHLLQWWLGRRRDTS